MPTVKRWKIVRLVLSRLLARTFPVWERLGFHVTVNHFYGPVPDSRSLPDEIWDSESALVGVDLDTEKQLVLLEDFVTRYRTEYDKLPTKRTAVPHQFSFENKTFVGVDAEILYCFVRSAQPKTIIEIGSGQSTYLMAQAALTNIGAGATRCDLTVIDPYPAPPVHAGFPGLTRLIQAPVESVPLSTFETLGESDILFIDTSHVLRVGGDVKYEFLEVLPRLKPGVLVHVHDIFLPVEYPRDWVMRERLFFNEQYLLQAFLAFNSEFEVLWAGHHLHRRHPERLARAFASYDPRTTLPGSFWLRRLPLPTA